ncbi:hypothetical protein [Synechococcus sp. UW140]|uniref:hypothetical protein n=1 Tax=Synechococcus sp. UW140 TaxID=368503 RepID=UPI003137E12A
MTAESPALGPLGQVRIYKGAQHRFIWPVHLAGWLELGWTTEPMATSGVTSGAIGPGVTSAPRKKRVRSTPSPTNENPTGANPSGASTSSATADEPLPVLVTDFLVDPSVPTND